MDPEQIEDVAPQSSLPKPGGLIRKAREQRGLDNEALSQRTRLSEAVLAHLQNDDFSALGQPVYARGYYRKCAEVLGLNGEALVEAYEQHSGTASPIPVIDQRPSIAYREGPGRSALIAALGLMAIVFGLSGLWLWDDEPAASRSLGSNVGTALGEQNDLPAPVAAGAVSANAEQGSTAASQPQQLEQASDTKADASADQAADFTEPDSGAIQLASADAADSPVSVELVEVPAAREESEWGAAAAAQSSQADTAAANQEPAQSKLDLRVQIEGGDAWVEVYARTGERLLYKLLHDGDARDVSGHAPYRLNLGRADNVRLLVNGQVLDFSKQIDVGAKAAFWLDAQGRIYDDQSGDAG